MQFRQKAITRVDGQRKRRREDDTEGEAFVQPSPTYEMETTGVSSLQAEAG